MKDVKSLRPVTHFTLTIPEPFNFRLTVAKPAGWHWSTPSEVFNRDVLRTGLYLEGIPLGLKLSARKSTVNVITYANRRLSGAENELLKKRIADGLGATEDLPGFYKFAVNDPILARVINDLYGLRPGRLDDVFGRVILAILLQMAPWKRSRTMMNAILASYGTKISFDKVEITLWPRSHMIASAGENELKRRANIGYRAGRLKSAAGYLANHPISISELDNLTEEDAVKHLMEIPGVGRYSAGIIYGRNSLPVDAWSVIVLSELFLGHSPQNPRQEIDAVTAELKKRWGEWSWMAFVYVANDLPKLARMFKLSRVY